jgi:hypothetical protein
VARTDKLVNRICQVYDGAIPTFQNWIDAFYRTDLLSYLMDDGRCEIMAAEDQTDSFEPVTSV